MKMARSRVVPIKPVTIPKLELTVALCSVKVGNQLRQELEHRIDHEIFCTDSKVVLGYIGNENRRFHVFVTNRVQEIHDNTSVEQWRYVESEQNPADDASRGMKARELSNSRWIFGPAFLWNEEDYWPTSTLANYEGFKECQADDPEVKKAERNFAQQRKSFIKMYSSLYKLDPFLDEDGILRVGGGLRRANLSYKVKYPVIMPKAGHVSILKSRKGYHAE